MRIPIKLAEICAFTHGFLLGSPSLLYMHVLYSITEFFLVSQRLSSLWSGAKEYKERYAIDTLRAKHRHGEANSGCKRMARTKLLRQIPGAQIDQTGARSSNRTVFSKKGKL
jgi:hypothetical protein